MSSIEQVVFQPNLYVEGLRIGVASNTTLVITSGKCRDSLNNFDMSLDASDTTLDAEDNGVNGLDTGTFQASKFYYVFVIGDPYLQKPTATLLSLSATAPVLPFGYSAFRRIGNAATDGSTHFVLFDQTGESEIREYFYDPTVSVLSGGTSTSYATVDLTAAVPPLIKRPVLFKYSYTPNTAGNAFGMRPTGSTQTSNVNGASGVVAAKAQIGQIEVLSKVVANKASVDYIVNASDSLSLLVSKYTDFI